MPRDIYSTDPCPRTVEPIKVLVDVATLGRVQRAMSGRCHECRGGERKNVSGRLVKCELCKGTGHRTEFGASQIASATGTGITKTICALEALKKDGIVAVSTDASGSEMWRLVRR
jgi:hypothetical protein